MGDSIFAPLPGGGGKGGKGTSVFAPLPKGKGRKSKWWNAPSRVADVVVSDAKSLAVSIPKEAWKTGTAAAQVASPYSSAKDRKKGLKTIAGQAADVARGVEEVIPNPKRLPYGDVSLVQIKDGKVSFWVPGGEADDSRRAAEAWKTRPLTSTLTAVGVVAPGAGAISVGRLAKSIRRENRTYSQAHALNLARRESRNPGYLAAQGIKGGLAPRTLRSEIPGGKTREVELPQARTAIGRRGQEVVDSVSRVLPKGAPLSERRRANRQLAREADETDRRSSAKAANLMEPVRKVAFGTKSRRRNQALLAYALQTPRKAGDPFAGPRAVADKFDEILRDGGYAIDGRVRRITPSERARLTRERDGIRRALADPPDPQAFAMALAAMQQVSREASNISKYVVQGKAQGVSPARAAQLDKVFDERRNLLSQYLGLEGEALGYFPHRTKFDLRSSGTGAMTRPAGDLLGRPQPSVNMNRNELRLFHSGKLSNDPRLLEQVYAANQRFLDAETRRRELFDEAVPLDMLTGEERGGYLIRDPDRAPASLSAEQRAMSNPRRQALELLDEGDEDGALQAWREQWLRPDSQGVPEEWSGGPDSIRWVPRDVVEKRMPRRVAVDPAATGRPLLGTVNALARIATIQGKPARYLLTNTVQNIVTTTITNPAAALAGLRGQVGLARSVRAIDRMWRALRLPDGLRARRPDLYRLISAETGDVQATAGLPTIRPGVNTAQRAERFASTVQQGLGETLGSVADTPYRNAVWMKHAKRYGAKTDAQLERLLTSDDPAVVRVRRQVMQATRDDMYDFNRISRWERDTIARFFFLWPLVRAGARYPVTYTRDYPIRAGAGASLTLDEQSAEDIRARDLFKFAAGEGEYDTGWAMPHGIAVEQLENLRRVMGGDFYAAGSMLSPPLRDTGQALFGYERPFPQRAERAARSLFPGFAPAQDVYREGYRGLPVVKRFTPQAPR